MKKIPICGVYKITSPSKKIYIGQSVNILLRWRNYRSVGCKMQPILHNSFKKYGTQKHVFEIICECPKEGLNELEKYYINLHQTFNNKYGMNLREGGGCGSGFSDETKRKMRNAKLGKKMTIESRNKMSESRKGRIPWNVGHKWSQEHKDRIRNALVGRVFTDEHKKKIGLKTASRIITEETRIKQRLARLGEKSFWFGRKHTEEEKLKMSKSNMGKNKGKSHPNSPEEIENIKKRTALRKRNSLGQLIKS